ncbi:hypothetical protein ISS42_01655 [Candidatus Shapirobacteria bacterium]|nr:hypothetical protein [Candidatus Shapirobacteria bacterium]
MAKQVLKYFFLLQIILLFAWFLGREFLPIKDKESSLIWSRANFDGVHYVTIARGGYGYLQQAFFPFYPKVIAGANKIVNNYLLSGILVSNFFLLLSMVAFSKLLELEKHKKKAIKQSLLLLFFFPTAFFFTSVYTESLFLFLALASFYFARRGKFGWAGLIAGLASYTCLAGIFLLPALLTEYYQQSSRRGMKERLLAFKERVTHPQRNHFLYLLKSRTIHARHLFYIALSSWGLVVYMNYLGRTRGDPFYFVRIQSGFGAQRSVDKLILIYQVFWRYLKMILAVNPAQWLYFNVWLEFSVALLFLFLLLWGWYKKEEYKIRTSWLVFASASYFLPTLTGTLLSLPRFVLTCFPCFIVLNHLLKDLAKKKPWLPKIYWVFSFVLLIICSALFFSGYWVA